MQVSKNVRKLAVTVDYLSTQINFLTRFVEEERKAEFKEDIGEIIKVAKKMLSYDYGESK